MSELVEAINSERLNREEDFGFEVKVRDIDCAGRFASGWLQHDFIYEVPTVFIECDSSLGSFQIEVIISNGIKDSGLYYLIQNGYLVDKEVQSVDITSIVGEKLYVKLNDDSDRGIITPDPNSSYRYANSGLIYEGGQVVSFDEFEDRDRKDVTSGVEPRSNFWMNTVLSIDYRRMVCGTHGWLEIPLKYLGESNDGWRFGSQVFGSGNSIEWSFKQSIRGTENVNNFLSEIGIEYTPNEFEDETIWIKPLRDIHYTNRPDPNSVCIDDLEFWVASNKPKKPEYNPSILEKIKSFLPSTSSGIEVSVNSGKSLRRAKSSLRHNRELQYRKESELPQPTHSLSLVP